jgi:hypothetical protein
MWMILVPAVFAVLFLLAFAAVAFFNPTQVVEEEIDARDTGGNLVKVKVSKTKVSGLGTAMEIGGLILLPLLAVCIFVLVVDSDHLVQTRMGLWSMCGVGNPDGAHAVLDAPDELTVTSGSNQVTFTIPKGVDPLWIIVTVKREMDVDSLLVPLDANDDGKVTFTHAKIKESDSVKVMYGTAIGPSAEAEWKKPNDASSTTAPSINSP